MSRGAGVLFVEDEAPFRRFAGSFLEENGFRVTYAANAAQALAAFDASGADLVLLDLNLPDLNGLEVLRRLRSRANNQKVIVLTAYGDAENAVRALKAGATDYLTKPIELERLQEAVRSALESSSAVGAQAAAEAAQGRPLDPGTLLGDHPSWRRAIARLERIAASDLPNVLLLGESGTGKTAMARRFHRLGPRRAGAFIEVNVPAIPAALLESELFGYERGAFAGAGRTGRGQVELADGGTLFLDEIGELPSGLQSKLLQFLEDRAFRRVGGQEDLRADVRLVCATNRDLRVAVESGALRRDLYYRLEVVSVELPPLRERGDDVIVLAEHFLEEQAKRGDRPPLELTEGARQALRDHSFPGNVRELKHVIDRSAAFVGERARLDAADLDLRPPSDVGLLAPGEGGLLQPVELEAVLNALEAHYVEQALTRSTSQRQAGELLRLDRFALARRRNRINRLGGKEAAGRVLAAAPAWVRGIISPHPADLPGDGLDLLTVRSELEGQAIGAALRATAGNRARAATLLGMSRTSLSRRLEQS